MDQEIHLIVCSFFFILFLIFFFNFIKLDDSVFVFDVRFPNDYPKSPPLFHFHSVTGEKINPNLYTNGGICLSLLGTWHGEGVEIWNPNSSNVLQVSLIN